MVYALDEYPDLVSQGLRTLELCIVKLTAEYFNPIVDLVVEDVTKTLFKLLRPRPINHTICHTALRILGKLGGRNRRFLNQASDLKAQSELDIELNAFFEMNELVEEVPLSLTTGIKSALEILEDYRVHSGNEQSTFKYLSFVFSLNFKSSTHFRDNYDRTSEAAIHAITMEKIKIKQGFKTEPVRNNRTFHNQEKLFLS
ncbi:uncharacterized protein ZBAI_01359 [Zygosaccharomyces bailii ISA1307]|nr:uncharacterized protein ZBAI_01359 [Zygosaccharomyces bailii ISA1307]